MQELIKVIQDIQVTPSGPVASVSRKPVTGDENEFVEAMKSRRVDQSSEEELKQVLRYIMIKVGLRAPNWPEEEEKAVLMDHIRRYYGGHRLEEIRLAFNLATTGSIKVDTNHYENFSCSYFSSIMNAYRVWALEKYDELIPVETKEIHMPKLNTRGMIEDTYQQFLQHGTIDYKLFPLSFHAQIVEDNYFNFDYHDHLIPQVRKQLTTEIQRDLTALIMENNPQNETRIATLQKTLNQYRAGDHDNIVVARSKQLAVWILFKEARKRKMSQLYQQVDAPKQLCESCH